MTSSACDYIYDFHVDHFDLTRWALGRLALIIAFEGCILYLFACFIVQFFI